MDLVLMSKVTGNLITATLTKRDVVVSWGEIDQKIRYDRFVKHILLNKKFYWNMGQL